MDKLCPLPDDRYLYDREGFVWENDLPDECRSCLLSALANVAVEREVKLFEVTDELTAHHERFSASGVRTLNDMYREGKLVAGYETSRQGGAIDTATSLTFACSKAI